MKNIVLVGFMASGKSVVGKLLAKKLDRDFVELDAIIEAKEKMPISDIFDKKGEPYFRSMEREVAEEASAMKGVVIAAGGGAIVDEKNFASFKRNGIIICLKASPETILNRTKGLKTRPLLNVPDPKKQIQELLAKRESSYSKADFSIDTDALSVEQVTSEIIKRLT